MVKLLLVENCDVDKADTTHGRTPLCISSQKGHVEVVRLLLAAGSDVDKADTTHGRTPVSISSQYGHVGVVRLLLQAGCDVNKADTTADRLTPLFVSSQWGQEDVSRLLLSATLTEPVDATPIVASFSAILVRNPSVASAAIHSMTLSVLIWDTEASHQFAALVPPGDADSLGAEVYVLENQICSRFSFACFVFMAVSRLRRVFLSYSPRGYTHANGPLSFLPRFPLNVGMQITFPK